MPQQQTIDLVLDEKLSETESFLHDADSLMHVGAPQQESIENLIAAVRTLAEAVELLKKCCL